MKGEFTMFRNAWPFALLIAIAAASALLAQDSQPPAAAQNQTKFTPPPGDETAAAKKLIAAADTALRAGKSTSDILSDPAFLSAHEWPRFRKLIRKWVQSSQATIVTPNEPGAPLVVTGKVVDRNGQLRAGALIYV
jgi:hypothetical protein